jgi:hypothetical protein
MAQDEYCVHVDFAYDIKCKRMSEKNKNKKKIKKELTQDRILLALAYNSKIM